MHSSAPEILDLPPEVRVALGRSRVVVGELDMAEFDMAEMFASIMLPQDQRLQDLLPPELHARTLAALEELGIPALVADRMQPWIAAAMLSWGKEEMERMSKGAVALDEVLQEHARDRGKPVIALESAQEQLSIFQEMPLAYQIEYLETVLAWPGMMSADGPLKQLYLAGDHRNMWGLYRLAAHLSPTPFMRYFTQTAVVDRNHRMAERLAPILAEGGAFVAVGALHLPGPEGLFNLLQAEGWRITALP
jgi:uncharacterized protein YbaP (TraB family)